MPRLAAILPLILALFAISAHAQPLTTPREAVERMVAAVEAQDASAVAALYAEQSLVLSPNTDPLVGRDAIQQAWARNFAAGYSSLRVGNPRVDTGADRAAMIFLWEATIAPAGGEARTIRGRSLLYFVRSGDGWLISADSWHPI